MSFSGVDAKLDFQEGPCNFFSKIEEIFRNCCSNANPENNGNISCATCGPVSLYRLGGRGKGSSNYFFWVGAFTQFGDELKKESLVCT